MACWVTMYKLRKYIHSTEQLWIERKPDSPTCSTMEEIQQHNNIRASITHVECLRWVSRSTAYARVIHVELVTAVVFLESIVKPRFNQDRSKWLS